MVSHSHGGHKKVFKMESRNIGGGFNLTREDEIYEKLFVHRPEIPLVTYAFLFFLPPPKKTEEGRVRLTNKHINWSSP